MTATAAVDRASARRRRVALIGLVAALALIALACSNSKKSTDTAAGDSTSTTEATSSTSTITGVDGGSSTSSTTTATGTASGASVAVASTSLGPVVVDDKGFTLYLFEQDTGPTSTCTDACAKAWPPAVVPAPPTAGTGVTGALTTPPRPDGSTQIVLAGPPLYRFVADTAPGDVTGQDVGGTWYAVSPAGET